VEPLDLQAQLEHNDRYGFKFNEIRLFAENETPRIPQSFAIAPPGDSSEPNTSQMASPSVHLPCPKFSYPVRRPNPSPNSQQAPIQAKSTLPATGQLQPDEDDADSDRPVDTVSTPASPAIAESDEEPLQTQPGSPPPTAAANPAVNASLESRLTAQRGGGSPLSPAARYFMEPRFGFDFSKIRIHADGEATQMNQALHAQAFTHGHDIYFGADKYDPTSDAGKQLLAHELTHTVQQTGGEQLQQKPGNPERSHPDHLDAKYAKFNDRASSTLQAKQTPQFQAFSNRQIDGLPKGTAPFANLQLKCAACQEEEEHPDQFLANKPLQTKLSPTWFASAVSEPIVPVKPHPRSRSLNHQEQPTFPQIQLKCATCQEEKRLQRQPLTPKITPYHRGNAAVQGFGWDDIPGAKWVGDKAQAGAKWVGDKAGQVANLGKEAFAAIVARVAPGLAALIRTGPLGLLTEKLKEGIKGWLSGLVSGVNLSSIINGLKGSFTGVFEAIKGVAKGDPASCAAFAHSIKALQDLGQAFMNNPVIKQLQAAFSRVSGIFKKVTDLVIAPVFEALMGIAGGVFNTVKKLASTIWEWGSPVRKALGAAWNWVKQQLGIGGDGEGGILGWLKTKASEAWAKIKGPLSPVIGPLKTVGTILFAFSPVGQIVLIIKFVPKLVKAVQWLWAHKDDKDIVRNAHKEMGNTILPQLLSTIQGFSQVVQSTVTHLVNQAVQLSEAVLKLLGAVSGIPLLNLAQSLVRAVSNGVKEIVTWGRTAFQAVSKTVQEIVAKVIAKIKPYASILSSIGLAIVNPGMIPVILAGSAWRLIPDCYKAPIINFLLDIVIRLLQAAPSLPMFGLLWPMIKAGVIGFLQGVKNQSDKVKVAITNKLAKIISGGSPAFIWGFVKGLLKGLWEGLTDPFVLIYQAIEGLSNVITWLENVADQALAPAPATQTAGATQTGAATTTTNPNQVAMGERMRQMAGELQPPTQQVTKGLMPALKEVFSGGGNLTFGQLMQKLGDAWAAVEQAIRKASATLAQKVCEFMMQGGAEAEMGESVGWLTGTIAFEVVLGILTAGSWQAASGAMKVLKLFAKILDWTGEALGAAFKALAKVGGFIIDGIKGLGKLLSKAGGAAKSILEALGTIGRKLIAFAEELLGFAKKAGKGAAEEAAEKVAKETAGEAAEKASKEAVEMGGEKATKEAAEVGGEKAAKEGAAEGADQSAKKTTDEAKKAVELAAAIAAAKGITAANDAVDTPVSALLAILNTTVKPKYSWLERFEAHPKRPGHYSIHMIASDHEIDSDYSTTNAKIDKLEADANEFEAQLKEASAKRREAEIKASEARATADEAASRAKAAEADVKAVEAKIQEAEAKAKAAEAKAKQFKGTVEGEQAAKQAEQAKQEALKLKQEAEQAKQEALKAREDAMKAKEDFKKAEEAKDKAKQGESEARQLEAVAREEASLAKQDMLTKQKETLQTEWKAWDKQVKELDAEIAKVQKKIDEVSKNFPSKRGAEREAARQELDKLRKQRDAIAKNRSDKAAERTKLTNRIQDIEKKIQAEIRASREVSPEIAKKLRENSPSDTVRKWVNDPSNSQVKFDPVSGKPIDPVYGKPVDTLSADHIVPLEEIKQMPGFNKLTYEQQLEVANLKENMMGIDPRVNSAKQDKSWAEFTGHSEMGSIDPKVKAQLIQAEKDARLALEKAIKNRLP
jgi:hypothetical protein